MAAAAASTVASINSGTAAQIVAIGAMGQAYATALQPVVAGLSTGFARLDANTSKTLDLSEFTTALRGKATDAEIQRLFALIDTDNDRIISAAEAQAAASRTFGTQVAVSLAKNFDRLDTSVNGLISKTEFSAAFAGLATDDTLASIFTAIDTNGDGTIDLLESIKASATATAANTCLLYTSPSPRDS